MKTSLLRAAMVGLGLGILLGGVLLLYMAWVSHSGLDCSGLSPAECAFERDARSFLARRQATGGAALLILGLGTFLLLRKAEKRN